MRNVIIMLVLMASAVVARAERPATHGMVIMGHGGSPGNVYMYHLPMFNMAEHSYQGIWSVSITTGVDQKFRDEQRRDINQLFTLVPAETFLLPTLADTNSVKYQTGFKAHIFKGHFERGGTRLTTEGPLTVRIEKVIYFEHLPIVERRPREAQIQQYIQFGDKGRLTAGEGRELFLAHRLVSAPDFDHIVRLDENGWHQIYFEAGELATPAE